MTQSFFVLRTTTMLAVMAVAMAVVLSGCKKSTDATPEVAVSVQAGHPTVGPISEMITADAILAPLAQASLTSRVSSPIRAEYVRRGARVRKGQLLMTLEDRDLQGAALDAKGSLTSAEATYSTATGATLPEEAQKAQLDVTQAKANLEVALRTASERSRLFKEGALSGRDADAAYAAGVQAQAAYDTAAKHLVSVQKTMQSAGTKAAEGQLTSARGRFANAAAQASYATLRSPIDGVVTDRPLFPGETATAGTTVMTVMDTSSLLAKLHIAQASAQKLAVGDAAEIQLAGVDQPVSAAVTFISPALDPGSTTVEIWLKLPNGEGRFKVGTPVHVLIHGNTVQNALQVPPGALVPAEDGSQSVMTVGVDGKAHKRLVKIGIRTPETIQVIDGLSADDRVITAGSYGLDDGTKVTITAADKTGGEKD